MQNTKNIFFYSYCISYQIIQYHIGRVNNYDLSDRNSSKNPTIVLSFVSV